MFRRLTLDGWYEILPYLGFGLIAFAFVFFVIRAASLKKSEVERLSHLPLREDFTEEGEAENDSENDSENGENR